MYQAAFSKSSYMYQYIVGIEAGNERKPGLYCCNYCDKDLSGLVRFKCAVCMDFDLCVECFSVGVELNRHKNSHPYRVMVSFQRRAVYLNSIQRFVS
jgi:transcriptional adapter 2-alpha